MIVRTDHLDTWREVPVNLILMSSVQIQRYQSSYRKIPELTKASTLVDPVNWAI
jgi:hypothetical protein